MCEMNALHRNRLIFTAVMDELKPLIDHNQQMEKAFKKYALWASKWTVMSEMKDCDPL